MSEPTLLDLDRAALGERLAAWGEPRFRADQIWRAVYREHLGSYAAISTLPRSLRDRLEEGLRFDAAWPRDSVTSADGRTTKVLFSLADGEAIESVVMQAGPRATVCVSTQVGCPVACPLCATGQLGFRRDLSVGEIVGQVLHFARELGRGGARVTNVVYMGMGEPLLNYEATLRSIRILNDPEGFSLRARGFTVSTAGIVPGIDRLAGEDVQVNLAVSLHAGNDRLRNVLVPVNRRYLLSALLHACRSYVERTHRRVSFEVVLINGVNDSPDQAREIAALLDGLLCHVNLIALNPVEGSPYRPSPRARREEFARELKQAGVPATLRVGRGVELQAGCGQLRGRAAAAKEDGAEPSP